jgi:GNAT superfamily N-acetyltransferase
MTDASLEIHPATPGRWADFEALFGPKGAVGGCWCAYWRASAKAVKAGKGEGNKALIRRAVEAGPPPGLIACLGGKPAGWCAVAPRTAYPRLQNSRILAPVDAEPVWSVTCFFLAREARGRRLSVALLKAARAFVAAEGGRILEGYPVEPVKSPYPAAYAWTGFAGAFREAGFTEVARRSPTRPIMRAVVG